MDWMWRSAPFCNYALSNGTFSSSHEGVKSPPPLESGLAWDWHCSAERGWSEGVSAPSLHLRRPWAPLFLFLALCPETSSGGLLTDAKLPQLTASCPPSRAQESHPAKPSQQQQSCVDSWLSPHWGRRHPWNHPHHRRVTHVKSLSFETTGFSVYYTALFWQEELIHPPFWPPKSVFFAISSTLRSSTNSQTNSLARCSQDPCHPHKSVRGTLYEMELLWLSRCPGAPKAEPVSPRERHAWGAWV